MRSANAKSIKKAVYKYCAEIAHPDPKRIYRRVKRAYLETPRPLRHRFDIAQGKVI